MNMQKQIESGKDYSGLSYDKLKKLIEDIFFHRTDQVELPENNIPGTATNSYIPPNVFKTNETRDEWKARRIVELEAAVPSGAYEVRSGLGTMWMGSGGIIQLQIALEEYAYEHKFVVK
jgi:hypothetical protein